MNQRQDSLYDQLKTLIRVANEMGCYDASDFLKETVDKIENKGKVQIAFCCKCTNKMTQPNLFDTSQELVGCSLLTKKQWENGMKNGNQTNCPLLKETKNNP